MMFFLSIIFLFVQQTGIQQTAADLHYAAGLPVTGRLVFPIGFPQQYLDITLENESSGITVATTKSGPNGEFRFDGVGDGQYVFVISARGLQYVRQRLMLDRQQFGLVRVAIPLRRLKAKSLIDAEDTVSIWSLKQDIPNEAVKAVEKGLEEQQKGNLVKTASELERAFRIAPGYYEANVQLGIFYHKQGRREEARDLLVRALEMNPASRKARAVLGLIYYETEDFQKSADILNESARLGNTSADLYYLLGMSYLHLGELELAEQTLQRTIALSDGTMGETHLQLHNVYLRLKEPRKALEQLDSYLQNFPNAVNRLEIQSKAEVLRKALAPGV
jgi:tetratricopeptide (TPR) repeat protein